MQTIANFFKKITDLFNVKSIITIALTIVFCIIVVQSEVKVTSDQFLTIFTVIISFYFGFQNGKKNNDEVIPKETESKEDI